VYVDYDYILGGKLLAIKKNKKLINFQKGGWRKVNVYKNKYMVMSGDQDMGRNPNIKINNIFY
jgi:hypothetical protein